LRFPSDRLRALVAVDVLVDPAVVRALVAAPATSVTFEKPVHVAAAVVDFAAKTSSDGTVERSSQFPIGRRTL
jgi:hypothetical protein